MDYLTIIHHGAFEGVTGSCHQLFPTAHVSFLIDCGLFQGAEAGSAGLDEGKQQRIEFSIVGLKALVLHIDHVDGLSRRVVFSGDLGSVNTPMLPRPRSPERADILVLESTYGDRLHEDGAQRQVRFEAIIERALVDQGTVLIPAFSIGRTQELLYEIEDILHKRALATAISSRMAPGVSYGIAINWPELPIILDSLLATRFTRVYEELNDFWLGDAQDRMGNGNRPLNFPQLITIDSHQQHMKVVNYLASTGRPSIVIAGGGGVFQGTCRVSYLTMLRLSLLFPLAQGSASSFLLASSYVSDQTIAPVFCSELACTAHGAWQGSDHPVLGASAQV